MRATTTTRRSTRTARIAAATLSLALITGAASTATAAPKTKAKHPVAAKRVVKPVVVVRATPSVTPVAAPAWQTGG